MNFLNYFFPSIEFLIIICGYFKKCRKTYKEHKLILEIILSTIISQIKINIDRSQFNKYVSS